LEHREKWIKERASSYASNGDIKLKEDSTTIRQNAYNHVSTDPIRSRLTLNDDTTRNSPIEELLGICKGYGGQDYFVRGRIPARKLQSSIENYPVPNGGPVVAIIDGTVFGSAKIGLAVGEHGISWSNGQFEESKIKMMCWKDLKSAEISKTMFKIKIGESFFDMGASNFDQDQCVNLLKEIQQYIASNKYFNSV